MAYFTGPNIVTSGLVYAIDAGSERSYPGSGTVATDLVGTNNGTLTNGVGFSNVNGGTWDFDGVNDYIDIGNVNPATGSAITLSAWIKLDSIPSSQASAYPQIIGKRDIDLQRAYFFSFQKSVNKVYWEIKDNAGGIKENIINKIFEPYFTTKHQSQGTGIGLYMSQNIVTNHLNGVISVKNEDYSYDEIEYKGAKFTIIIN